MLRGRKLSRVVLAGRRMLCVARGPGQGLLAFDGRAWQPDFVPPDRSEPPSAEWVVASGDAVWAGARAYGIARYAGGKWTRHNVDVGPHSGVLRATESAAPDGKGGLWVGARGAICRYQGSWSCEELGSHPVSSIALDPQGRIWVGTSGAGIARQSGGAWVRFGEREGLPGLVVRQVLVGPDGSLFGLVEVERGRAAVVRLGSGETRFQILGSSEGMGVAPTALATDAEGRVWVGTAAATLYRWDGKRLEPERRYDGLRAAAVTRLAFDRGNHPWVIREGARGVRHHDGSRWVAFERATGLLSDVARDLAVAPGGAIWVATDEGLTEYVPKE
jgi:ligand-binding sensor domain-containing protein